MDYLQTEQSRPFRQQVLLQVYGITLRYLSWCQMQKHANACALFDGQKLLQSVCGDKLVTLSSGSSMESPTLAVPDKVVPVSTVPCPLIAKQWSITNLKGPVGDGG